MKEAAAISLRNSRNPKSNNWLYWAMGVVAINEIYMRWGCFTMDVSGDYDSNLGVELRLCGPTHCEGARDRNMVEQIAQKCHSESCVGQVV